MFCCDGEGASSPHHRLHQRRRCDQRRGQQQRRSLSEPLYPPGRPITPRTARKLVDLDQSSEYYACTSSSPRKGSKDVVSTAAASKSRARQDVEEKSKPKKPELAKKSSKKDVKVNSKAPNREPVAVSSSKVSGSGDPAPTIFPGNESGIDVEKPLGDLKLKDKESEGIANDHCCDKASTSARTLSDAEGDKSASVSASPAESQSSIGQSQGQQRPQQGQGEPAMSFAAPQKPPHPIHGILKDTSGSRRVHGTGPVMVEGDPYHLANGVVVYDGHSSKPGSRSDSSRGSLDAVYQQSYGSLTRSSGANTPTPDNIYSYGSLNRRTNAITPSHSNGYPGGQNCGSLQRKAGSDFHVDSLDRNGNYAVINYGHPSAQHGGKNYAPASYQSDRPGSVPPSITDVHNPLYGEIVSRPGSVPPHYYSDTDSSNYYRSIRGGSVPIGYDSESSAYGSLGSTLSRPRHYDSDTGYTNNTNGGSSSMKVHPGDEQYRAGPGKRPVPRRHTVGISGSGSLPRGDPSLRSMAVSFISPAQNWFSMWPHKTGSVFGTPKALMQYEQND
ncbi:hypothetical protein Btru_060504 [Bulinus truncatus]|nr:hypothetical protein Btru_060504 [Bulinus truncatus]